MPSTYIINGKVETFCNAEQFKRALPELFGNDTAELFQEMLDDAVARAYEHNPYEYCNGECGHTYRIQEHYQRVISDAVEDLRAYYSEQLKLRSPKKLFMLADAINNLNNEL